MAKKAKAQAAPGVPPEWDNITATAEELRAIDADALRLRGTNPGDTEISELKRRLAEAAKKIGGYYVAPTPALLSAGISYYLQHVRAIREALTRGGADAETVEAVTMDYGATLTGLFEYHATPEQMQIALNACSPLTGYLIDKYGLFVGLLYSYKRNLAALVEYRREVKQEPDAAKRDFYFDTVISAGEFTDLQAAALYWMLNTGVITAADFAGIEQDTIQRFLNFVTLYGQNGRYVVYIFLARYALNVAPEQLKEIPTPPLFDRYTISPVQAALERAGWFADEINNYLARVGEQVEAVLSAPTPEETERAKEQAQATAARAVITIPHKYALLGSRKLWAADGVTKDGQRVNKFLPIEKTIEGYLARNPDALTTTPLLIQRAIEGVNLLQQLKRVPEINGQYTFDTNITEFSNLCGYNDANEKEKLQLLTALKVLDGLFCVLWTPKGAIAQRILAVESLGLSGSLKGRLRFHVYASGLSGTPKLISRREIDAMRAKEKGAAQMHFRLQILTKGHNSENNLVDYVFEYFDNRKAAQDAGDLKQLEAVLEFQRKNQSAARKKLRAMFDDYAARGIISYWTTTDADGKLNYNWKRLKPPTADELAELRPTLGQIEERQQKNPNTPAL